MPVMLVMTVQVKVCRPRMQYVRKNYDLQSLASLFSSSSSIRLFIKMLNKNGERIPPCLTPLIDEKCEEYAPFHITLRSTL